MLETRVEERTGELHAANLALAEADTEKTRFLAAASHDLLQPLHAARLFSAALKRESDAAQRGLLSKLDRSIDSAESLLRSLLDISKLDAGGVTPEAQVLRLRPLLAEMVETMTPLAREKGIDIRIGPGDATVETDPGLLRSIIQNFLSNAVRYTDAGGILVGIRRRGSHARIDVIDTGLGIAEEKQKIIFREFERLPNASEGGVGLGLAIVERTARLLDARISLRSRIGKGSRFSVSLSVSMLAVSNINPKEPHCSSPTGPLSILMVDDDKTNIEALRSYLEPLGHQTNSAQDGETALVETGSYDIALIDFNLGIGMDGLELARLLTEQRRVGRIALITAARPQDYQARAQTMGLTVFTKPVSLTQLDAWLAQTREALAAE
jgi:CheY-like chemotaxis protein